MHFCASLTAVALLSCFAPVHAGLVISNAPDGLSVATPLVAQPTQKSQTPPVTSASAIAAIAAIAANEAATKAARLFAIDSWAVGLPKGAREMCMAGVCLGDPIDSLPSRSANADGSRVRGDWQQVTGGGIIELDADPAALRTRQLQVFEDMRDSVFVCSLAELAQPLAHRMRLVFVPDEGSAGGMEVGAELLPKKRDTTKSVYAVASIEMTVRRGNGEEASAWPASIASLWPALKALPVAEPADHPERIAMWVLSEPIAKGVPARQRRNVVSYAVSPLLSANDAPFNAAQWDNVPVKHELHWMHGAYGINAATPSEVSAVDAALRKQKGCESHAKPGFAAQ